MTVAQNLWLASWAYILIAELVLLCCAGIGLYVACWVAAYEGTSYPRDLSPRERRRAKRVRRDAGGEIGSNSGKLIRQHRIRSGACRAAHLRLFSVPMVAALIAFFIGVVQYAFTVVTADALGTRWLSLSFAGFGAGVFVFVSVIGASEWAWRRRAPFEWRFVEVLLRQKWGAEALSELPRSERNDVLRDLVRSVEVVLATNWHRPRGASDVDARRKWFYEYFALTSVLADIKLGKHEFSPRARTEWIEMASTAVLTGRSGLPSLMPRPTTRPAGSGRGFILISGFAGLASISGVLLFLYQSPGMEPLPDWETGARVIAGVLSVLTLGGILVQIGRWIARTTTIGSI